MSRTQMGAGCPVCRGYRSDASTSLATLKPRLRAEWHRQRNGSLAPADITPGSHRMVWWRCAKCRHEWKGPVYARAKDGNGCRRCAGQVALPGDAATLEMKAPELYAELDCDGIAAGGRDPRTIHSFSSRSFPWRCSTDPAHVFSTSPNRRHQGCRCPHCPSPARTSREELCLLAAVRVIMGDALGDTPAGTTTWLNSRGQRIAARCDVVVPSRRLVIEYDGLAYHRHPKRVAGDLAKTAALLADGWRVVRLRECTKSAQLDHLNLQDPRLLQLSHRYGQPFAQVVGAIVQWVELFDGPDSAASN